MLRSRFRTANFIWMDKHGDETLVTLTRKDFSRIKAFCAVKISDPLEAAIHSVQGALLLRNQFMPSWLFFFLDTMLLWILTLPIKSSHASMTLRQELEHWRQYQEKMLNWSSNRSKIKEELLYHWNPCSDIE